MPTRKKLVEWSIYAAIGIGIVIALMGALALGYDVDSMKHWSAVIGYSAVLFCHLGQVTRSHWKKTGFWAPVSALVVAHVAALSWVMVNVQDIQAGVMGIAYPVEFIAAIYMFDRMGY